ncbi:MAG: hypothetical protein EA362_08965 [Saprospirales bacterium]|nr:MAG: hypothetical protein EA362_08965 [Saprospirales bacterium]
MCSKSNLYIASLKHTKAIQFLLTSGDSALRHPLLIKYTIAQKRHPSHPDILFTPIVSARKIRKACDRNLLKRRIRAAARNSLSNIPLNTNFFKDDNKQIQLLYIYLDKEIKDFNTIDQSAIFLSKKFIKTLVENATKS